MKTFSVLEEISEAVVKGESETKVKELTQRAVDEGYQVREILDNGFIMALYSALESGKIAGAALDVMEQEPPQLHEAVLTLDNIVVTPHIAYYSETSFIEVRRRALEEVTRVLKGEQPKNWVNRKEMSD